MCIILLLYQLYSYMSINRHSHPDVRKRKGNKREGQRAEERCRREINTVNLL
ncbi:hypothetical protein Hdeb2414_s0021g00576071 [Helianthus debilis subsp. tardiflorus]